MSYLLPWFFQKRLLRYALSRLEIVDTDALDLDNLGITWGKQCTFQLGQVGLRLEKLSSLLQLPSGFVFTGACVDHVYVTVPADILSSGIIIEVEGIQLDLKLLSNPENSETPGDRKDTELGSSNHSEAGSGGDTDHSQAGILPSTTDLAQSFLESEPREETAELEAALISQSQNAQQSDMLSDDGSDDTALGLHDGVSLPSFVAGFLKGIMNRLQLRIKDVSLKTVMEVQQDAFQQQPSAPLQPVTGLLTIGSIVVDGVAPLDTEDSGKKPGKRLIDLSQIHAMLISSEEVFSNYSRFNPQGMESPSQSRTTQTKEGAESPKSSSPCNSYSDHELEHSVILDQSEYHDYRGYSGGSLHPENSILSDDGRFSDAETDEEYTDDHFGGYSQYLAESRQYENELESSSYLNEAINSAFLDDMVESDVLNPQNQTTPNLDAEKTSPLDGRTSPASTELYHSMIESERGEEPIEGAATPIPSRILPGLSGTDGHEHPGSDEPTTPIPEDLSRSKLFSPEEARSLYMSVLSTQYANPNVSPGMPGAWSSQGSDTTVGDITQRESLDSEIIPDIKDPDIPVNAPAQSLQPDQPQSVPTLPPLHPPEHQDSPETAFTADAPPEATSIDYMKKIIEIEGIKIWVPALSQDTPDEPSLERHRAPAQRIRQPSVKFGESTLLLDSSRPLSPRGTFHRDSISSQPPNLSDDPDLSKEVQSSRGVEVEVSSITVDLDISCGWLLAKIGENIVSSLKTNEPPKDISPSSIGDSQKSPSSPIGVSVLKLSLNFFEHTRSTAYLPEVPTPTLNASDTLDLDDIIISLTLENSTFQTLEEESFTKSRFAIGKFTLHHLSDVFMSFDKSLRMRESIRDITSPSQPDIAILIHKTPGTVKINTFTLPVHLSLNLLHFDDTISRFSGFSTILELSHSTASAATVKGDNSGSKHRPRGVHFDQPSSNEQRPLPSPTLWKINSRIGGVVATIVGEHCSVKVETSALKIVNRNELVAIQTGTVRITGPYIGHGSAISPAALPVCVDVDNLRVDFLYVPKEVDLEPLLGLLIPSKDKYDGDDDIMLDTLFRQRRQGSVLRLTVTGLKTTIASIDGLQPLTRLADEAAKLSRVTKYLPQDDRPGILTLGLVHECEARVNVGGDVGELELKLRRAEVGYVGFPSLIAARVSVVTLTRNDKEQLIGQAVSLRPEKQNSSIALPMIMARYIAGEMEPTIKLKLHNAQVDYTVHSMLAFLSLKKEEITSEAIAANMAQSVVNFAELQAHHLAESIFSDHASTPSGQISSSTSPWRISVALKDCVLGLNPRNSPAKALVVLTDAHFTGAIQNDHPSEATFEVKKSSLMLVDNVDNIDDPEDSTRRNRSTSSSRQVQELERIGYVTICDASSAIINVKVMQLDSQGEKSLDVELKDNLLILETCADSTQTLISILNGLAPPAPPCEALKYRTEVVPIEDLLQSFAAECDDLDNQGNPSHFSPQGDEEEDETELVPDHEYISDFYPFHPRVNPPEFGDEIPGYEHVSSSDGPRTSNAQVSAGITQLDFQDDHFAKHSAVGGTAHRWDSSRNTYNLANEVKLRGSPLRVRVRNVHVIWNLYDGYDWQRTRDTISKAVKDLQTKAIDRRSRGNKRLSRDLEEEPEPVIGDFLFNSVYIEIPSNRDPREFSHDLNCNFDSPSETASFSTTSTMTGKTGQGGTSRREKLRLARSKHHKMSIELRGVGADLVVFPPSSDETQSSLDVRVHTFEIFDHVPTSTWKTFATYMQDIGERETGTSMAHLEILNVKPVADLAASELILKITILPLRLHVDQDALDFLSRFFEFKDESAPSEPVAPGDVPFLQRVEVNPIPVRLDFKPKRVDYAALRSGRTTEFMNLFVLDEADMVLRHVIIYGISGFEKLGKTLNDIWMPDVKNNQLGGVLAGLAPVKSFVNLGGGVRDLIVVPIREYKKDGRIVRSLQKGAVAFAKTTTSELIRLGAKLAIGTQNVLQGAEDYLNPAGPSYSRPPRSSSSSGQGDEPIDEGGVRQKVSSYAHQPVGVVQGLRSAYSSLNRDLAVARDAIIAVPGEVMESENATDAAKTVLRRTPTIVLGTAISATGAIGQTLLGARNSLDPENKRRADELKRPEETRQNMDHSMIPRGRVEMVLRKIGRRKTPEPRPQKHEPAMLEKVPMEIYDSILSFLGYDPLWIKMLSCASRTIRSKTMPWTLKTLELPFIYEESNSYCQFVLLELQANEYHRRCVQHVTVKLAPERHSWNRPKKCSETRYARYRESTSYKHLLAEFEKVLPQFHCLKSFRLEFDSNSSIASLLHEADKLGCSIYLKYLITCSNPDPDRDTSYWKPDEKLPTLTGPVFVDLEDDGIGRFTPIRIRSKLADPIPFYKRPEVKTRGLHDLLSSIGDLRGLIVGENLIQALQIHCRATDIPFPVSKTEARCQNIEVLGFTRDAGSKTNQFFRDLPHYIPIETVSRLIVFNWDDAHFGHWFNLREYPLLRSLSICDTHHAACVDHRAFMGFVTEQTGLEELHLLTWGLNTYCPRSDRCGLSIRKLHLCQFLPLSADKYGVSHTFLQTFASCYSNVSTLAIHIVWPPPKSAGSLRTLETEKGFKEFFEKTVLFKGICDFSKLEYLTISFYWAGKHIFKNNKAILPKIMYESILASKKGTPLRELVVVSNRQDSNSGLGYWTARQAEQQLGREGRDVTVLPCCTQNKDKLGLCYARARFRGTTKILD
ncbi:autophagy- protein 2 [Myotisia sp. PD_48]|nr:autophagy- protein 2 [Myotisia sp. PD_48]